MMSGMLLLAAVADDVVTPANVWRNWGGDPGSLLSIMVIAVWYGVGVGRLWSSAGRGHGVSRAEVASFYAGILVLLVALCSPLDAVADTLFSAHMLEHVLLITVAAPLAVLGAPLLPFMWALPRRARVSAGRTWNATGMKVAGATLATPLVAWGLHTVAIWVWHLPALYLDALASTPVHALEHSCFYVTALLMWWVAFKPLRGHGGLAGSLLVIAGTFAQCGALGAILTFSGTSWYGVQSIGASAWHLTPLEDQQLAGLIMWIPAGFVYLIGLLAVMRRVFDEPDATKLVPAPGVAAAMVLVIAIAGCSKPPSQIVPGGDAALGPAAIRHYGCGACHSIPGVMNAVGEVGPPLAGIADRRMIAGVAPNTPEELIHWIMVPQSMAPGNAMPDLDVSAADARNIAAYLYTLH
jgi:cytochrome c oxidase assembly factor CtaG/cytochrome c2